MWVNRAVILAAGLGTRLKWMSQNRPKALMLIQGEPAVVHVIRQLAAQGIRQIAVNTHHHAAQLKAYLGSGERWGVQLFFSHEDALLDSGGGVRTALSYLPGQGKVLVHNADVIADVNVQALSELCSLEACALALVDNPSHHPQGDFSLQAGKVGLQTEPRYTFSGVSVWDEQALLAYKVNTKFSLLSPIQELMKKQTCAGYKHQGQWFDIGRPKDVWRAHRQWRCV